MSQTQPIDDRPATTASLVFETILKDIVSGTYPPGARLPAERELARILGASRPTLREALRRLTEWNLVEPRRGSGIVVRNQFDWSIEVLPAYLRYASPDRGHSPIPQLIGDLLSLRKALIQQIVVVVAERFPKGGSAAPRRAIERAWAARGNIREFVIEDFQVVRTVVEAANFLPAVWTLNRLSRVYIDIAGTLTGVMTPPDSYVASHTAFLDALEAHDGETAARVITDYLEEHDRLVIEALEVFA